MLVRQGLELVTAALLVTPVVLGAATIGLVRRLLSWRPLVTIGIVGYGVYLWHLDVMIDMPGPWHQGSPTAAVTAMGVKIAMALALGYLSFHLLERPLMDRAESPAGHTTKRGNFATQRVDSAGHPTDIGAHAVRGP